MNWSRGFLRAWVVVSAIWFLAMAYPWFDEYTRCCYWPDPALLARLRASAPVASVITFDDLPNATTLHELIWFTAGVCAAPAALLLLGCMMSWVLRGFDVQKQTR